MNESGSANIRLGVTGIQSWAQVGNIITGINQGLELLQKGFEGATKVTKAFIDTGARFEEYERQLTAITGSADKAHQNVVELVEASKTMGDPIAEIMEATKQLELFGIYSKKNLEIIDDAADAMGKNITEVVQAIAMASEGNIRGLRQYGINALDVQRQLGHKMQLDTIEGLEEIGQAVLDIFEKSYKGAGEAADRTLGGMIHQLTNNWVAFKKEVSDAGPLQAAKDILGSILTVVHQLFNTGQASTLGQIVGETIASAMRSAALAMLDVAISVGRIADGIHGLWEKSSGVRKFMGWRAPDNAYYDSTLIAADPMWASVLGQQGRTNNAGVNALVDARNMLAMSQYMTVGPFPQAAGPGSGGGGGGGGGAASTIFRGAGGGYSNASSIFGMRGMFAGMGGALPVGPEIDPLTLGMRAVEAENEAAEARKNAVANLTSTLAGYWSSYYQTTHAMADMALSNDEKRWKKMRQIAWMGMRSLFADFIEDITKRAAIKQMEAIADMLLAGGQPWSWAKAANAAAAAAAYGAIGGIAGAVLRGGSGDMPSADEGASSGEYDAGYNSRSTTRSAGVKAQSVTYNLYVIHNAPAVYGSSDGIRELFEREFLPLLREYQGAVA